MENPIKMDDLGVPPFKETPILLRDFPNPPLNLQIAPFQPLVTSEKM